MKNYRLDRIMDKDKITVNDVLILDEYGIRYKNIEYGRLIVYYNGEEIMLQL